MNSASAILETAVFLLLFLTVGLTGLRAIRHRTRHEVDIFLVVASLLLILAGAKTSKSSAEAPHPVYTLVLLAQPYFLLRLVHYFRRVPGLLRVISLAGMALGTVAVIVMSRPRPIQITLVTTGYFTLVQVYAAWAFGVEARHKSGVTAWRLRFAAFGTGSFAVTLLTAFLWLLTRQRGLLEGPLFRLLSVCVVIGYVFGLATPRPIRRMWQRDELYRFLRETAERDPQDRGEHAAEDLSRAASRGAAGLATAVLLGGPQLTVRAASDVTWNGLTFEPDSGLLGRARLGPVEGTPQECEGELAHLTAAKGDRVIAVPLFVHRRAHGGGHGGHATDGGVLLVVQRRGSLFPEDDLDLLLRLSRHAADAMDHSRLLIEERERQKREADARIRESESRLHLMIESIKDYAMITVDADGFVTSWNVGASAVFGHSTGAIVGRSAAELFGEASISFPAHLDEARRTGLVVREGLSHRAGGTTFTGHTVIRPLVGDGTATEGFVVVTRDVTSQRELESRLRQAQKMEAIGQLAGGVAHDFNNMLTVILGYGALLESSTHLDEHERLDVIEIRKAADRAAALTRQLLTFSRQQVIEPRVVSLPTVVRGLLPMLRRVLGEDIEIVEDIQDTHPVLADPGQLEQIVVNLAVNARDAMAGGGRLTIRTSSVMLNEPLAGTHLDAQAGAYSMLEVRDTGTGMSEAVKARIFEPFFTTKEFGRGTGLGLATVYGIVKQLEGGINVASRMGAGTTFSIYVPRSERTAEHAAAPAPQAKRAAGSGTVLVVEDAPAVRLLVASTLEHDGFRVLSAENLTEAMERMAASTEPPRLVITDVVMPGGSGPELVRQLSASHGHFKAIFMSGYAQTGFGQSGLEPDHHFLQKPFTGRELLDKVRQVLSL